MLFKTTYKLLDYIAGSSLLQHKFMAGAISGFVLNSEKTPIKYQLVLYLFSRILSCLVSLTYFNINGIMADKKI